MGANDLRLSMAAKRNDLINKLLIVLNLLVLVAVTGSVIRYFEIGWHHVMGLHVAIAIILGLLTWYRNTVPYLFKAWIIVSMFFLAALGGLLTFGMMGGNMAIWIAMPIYAAALINTRAAMYLTTFSIVIFVLVGWLSVNGMIHTDVDYEKLAHSQSTWLSAVLAFPLFTYMLVIIFKSLDTINQELVESLDHQKNDLKKLNKVKDKIFSVISHDLRAPFQGLIGTLELIESDNHVFDRKDKERIFSKLLESSRGTHLMLENLLIWAQSEVNESELDVRPHRLADLLTEACLPYRQIAHNKGIEITVDVDPVLMLSCDAPGLKIVLSNLLSNAIKFSHRDSIIQLSALQASGTVIIRVSDAGEGMSRDQIEKILDPNEIHTTYGTANEKGSGLGMKICQKLVKQNGGSLRIESEPGKGSVFTLAFEPLVFLPADDLKRR